MKTRVISGFVIFFILIAVYVFMFTPVLDIMVMALAGAACYEVMKVAGIKNKPIRIIAILFSIGLVAAVIYSTASFPMGLFCMIYVLFLVVFTVCSFPHITFPDLAVTIYASFIIPLAFSTMSLVGDMYRFYAYIDKNETRLLLWNCVATALFTDVFAYFAGRAFGKHHMAPHLSPKKTWEGAIGGVVGVVLLNLVFLWGFHMITKETFFLPVWAYILMNVIVSILSMFGDLMASLIKRYYGVKDYSHLIPGHGGIMDRFDSVIMAAPAMYVFLNCYGLAVL